MKSELLHNLPEFIERNDITTAFGAVVAVAHANEDNVASFFNQLNLVHFYAVFLLIDGYAEVTINDKTIRLEQHSILRTAPMQHVDFVRSSSELGAYFLFIESDFYNDIVKNDDNLRDVIPLNLLNTYIYKALSESQTSEFMGSITQIECTISQPHAYKKEMLGQINFYADQMNITSTYLSRIVKEVSGNTVNGYLQSFLYGEACKLLRMTDMTIGEISFELNFKDHSAFTNFFKMKSGVSPKEYRNKEKSGCPHQ